MMMTKEEATEIILGQKPFYRCSTCNGLGFIPRDNDLGVDCTHCHKDPRGPDIGGTGKVINKEYREATKLLGLPFPEVIYTAGWAESHDD